MPVLGGIPTMVPASIAGDAACRRKSDAAMSAAVKPKPRGKAERGHRLPSALPLAGPPRSSAGSRLVQLASTVLTLARGLGGVCCGTQRPLCLNSFPEEEPDAGQSMSFFPGGALKFNSRLLTNLFCW